MLEFLLLVILLLLWNMADFFYTMIFNVGENFTIEKILGLTSEKVDFSSFNAFFNSLGYKFS